MSQNLKAYFVRMKDKILIDSRHVGGLKTLQTIRATCWKKMHRTKYLAVHFGMKDSQMMIH